MASPSPSIRGPHSRISGWWCRAVERAASPRNARATRRSITSTANLLAQHLADYLFVLLLVALFEADLGVLDDAAGVEDVRWSAKGVELAQVGLVPVEDRVLGL